MRNTPQQTSLLRVVLVFLSMILVSGSVMAGDVGRCLSAEIPSPVIMPDGAVFDAGKLKICNRIAYSPVSGLEEISINGRSLGMYVSRSSESPRPKRIAGERRDDRPVLVFFRNERDELELFSYHRANGDRFLHHVFGAEGNPKVDSYWKIAAENSAGKKAKRKSLDLLAMMQDENVVILLAAGP